MRDLRRPQYSRGSNESSARFVRHNLLFHTRGIRPWQGREIAVADATGGLAFLRALPGRFGFCGQGKVEEWNGGLVKDACMLLAFPFKHSVYELAQCRD
jgi:hypothetical protein